MDVSVQFDCSNFFRYLERVKRNEAYAEVLAINRIATRIRGEEIGAISRVFDRPSPFTLNSIFVNRATKQKPEARIFIRNEATKGTAPVKYLRAEVVGGVRNLKRAERALQAAGLLPSGMYVVPGAAARLDAYGNISAGTYTKILSALRANADPMQNRTRDKTSKRYKNGAQYFVGRPGGAPLGVWERYGAYGVRVRPILIFVAKQPAYRKRLPFYQIAHGVAAKHMQTEMRLALAQAIRTAR